MGKFIGYTLGLRAQHRDHDTTVDPLKVEFSETSDGVALRPVSGRSLGLVGGHKIAVIARDEFDSRPRPGTVEEARWAFDKLGFAIAGDA